MNAFSAEMFISTLPYPTIVIGLGSEVELANPPALRLLGDQIVQRHFMTALRQPSLITAIEDARASQQKQTAPFTATINAKDTVFDVQIVPTDSRLVLSFIDISEAQDLNSFRRDFVANVSHELRTPLASVLGFIETLRGPAKDDPSGRERFLGIMEREARRMARLVEDLLSLSRVEENQRRRPTTLVNVADVAHQAVTELGPIIDTAQAMVRVDDHSKGCMVLADAGQLRQVIGNLVENALRYGAQPGTVSIEITAPAFDQKIRQKAIRLAVHDDGPGIAAHHLPRLAERFYRGDSHRSRDMGGTGLGLAIVKHIAQRHRGRLVIESTMGKGSTFTVILPVSR